MAVLKGMLHTTRRSVFRLSFPSNLTMTELLSFFLSVLVLPTSPCILHVYQNVAPCTIQCPSLWSTDTNGVQSSIYFTSLLLPPPPSSPPGILEDKILHLVRQVQLFPLIGGGQVSRPLVDA